MRHRSFKSIDEWEDFIAMQRSIDAELARYDEECGEVITYNQGYCPLPSFGDWRDKQFGIRVWSLKVRKRDGFKCRRKSCGSTKNLHAHHIYNQADNPDIRFEEWNGITLCRPCHMAFHKIYGKVENNEDQIREFLSKGGDVIA